jgi:hypothetical protein
LFCTLVKLPAAAKILAVKSGISINQPACLVSLPALSACLPCQPACLVSLPAFSAYLPCQPACLVSLPALFCAHYLHFDIEVELFANYYTLRDLLYLDIYEKNPRLFTP